jgi:hypothetical protein
MRWTILGWSTLPGSIAWLVLFQKVQRVSPESRGEDADETTHVKTENLCGKYCIAFVNAGNISWRTLQRLSSSKFTPDQLVANLYRLNYGDNVL